LALLTTAQVEPFLGSKPYFGQGYQEGEIPAVDLPILEAARFRGAPTVFLGVSEPKANDDPPTIPPEELARVLVGTPFFSIDVTEVSQTELNRLVQTSSAGTDGYKLTFAEARPVFRDLSDFDAAVFAEARSVVDWNFRNKVRRRRRRFGVTQSAVPLSFVPPVVHPFTPFGEGGSCHAQVFYRRRIMQAENLA
jgi:NAD+ diphosphatase